MTADNTAPTSPISSSGSVESYSVHHAALLSSPVQQIDISLDPLFIPLNTLPPTLPAPSLRNTFNRNSSTDSHTVLRNRYIQPTTSTSPLKHSIVQRNYIPAKYLTETKGKARRRRQSNVAAYLPGTKRTNTAASMIDRQALRPHLHHAAHHALFDPMRFSNFSLECLLDVNTLADTSDDAGFSPRTKVVEIVSASEIVFCLTQSGVCLCFLQETMDFLCKVNADSEEVIRSLFFNRKNDSLITVSVHREDNFSSLKCKSILLKDIREKHPERGVTIFESESLRWPGFVEFDDVNGKVLTFSAQTREYKVWSLKEYKEIFTLGPQEIEEIKISCGVMLLIFNKARNRAYQHLPLKLIDIETGNELKSFKHLLKRNRKIDFIEQFNEKLLIKQEGEDLQILDVSTGEIVQVPSTEFMTPNAFIFLYELQLFLTFRDREVVVWNFKGECVTKFEDHTLMSSECNTNNIYISNSQEHIISYCKDPQSSVGSVNISNIFSGKCVGKISADGQQLDSRECEALDNVSAIFFNEEHNEFYIGTRNGRLSCWRN